MKNLSLSLLFPMLLNTSPILAKEISISIDDAPRRGTYLSGTNRAKRLIDVLAAAEIQAVFFCTTRGMRSAEGRRRIESYARAGHIIANHSKSHTRPKDLGSQLYVEDFIEADRVLSKLDGYQKWFRYPFLDYGRTVASRDYIREALSENGFAEGYVTVDNSDWYMDRVFQKAIRSGKKVHFERLRKLYVDALWDSVQFYDELAKNVIGRSPRHVLLLHENDLAALYLGDLIKKLKMEGWKFISPAQAYRDEISKMIPDTLINNNGRIAAIAHAVGFEGPKLDRYQPPSALDRLFRERRVFE